MALSASPAADSPLAPRPRATLAGEGPDRPATATSPGAGARPPGVTPGQILLRLALTAALVLLATALISGIRSEIAIGGLELEPRWERPLFIALFVVLIRAPFEILVWPACSGAERPRLGVAVVLILLACLCAVWAVMAWYAPQGPVALAATSRPAALLALAAPYDAAAPSLVWRLLQAPGIVTFAILLAMLFGLIAPLVVRGLQGPRPPLPTRTAAEARADDKSRPRRTQWGVLLDRYGVLAFLVLAVLWPVFYHDSRYHIDTATSVLIYVMLGWGLNIVVGMAGMLDLGYVAFYAVGAYTFAKLSTTLMDIGTAAQEAVAADPAIALGTLDQFALYFANHPGWLFFLVLPLAGILASLWGIMLGFPVLRLRGDYLAIVTLAFGEIIRVVLLNWTGFSGGPNGISQIPRPSFFGYEFSRSAPEGEQTFADWFNQTIYQPYIATGADDVFRHSGEHRVIFLYLLIVILALLTYWATTRLRRLPTGRAWEALREDEIACRSLGMNTRNVKLTAFAIGAMFGGFAGAFFATRSGFVSPNSFQFLESAIILAVVVLGGLGSQFGIIIAAIIIIGGFEVFRDLDEYRMLILGMAMISIMVWKPRGLLSVREPTIRMARRRAPAAGGAP